MRDMLTKHYSIEKKEREQKWLSLWTAKLGDNVLHDFVASVRLFVCPFVDQDQINYNAKQISTLCSPLI